MSLSKLSLLLHRSSKMTLLSKYKIASKIRWFSNSVMHQANNKCPLLTLNNGCTMPMLGLGTFKGLDSPTEEVTDAIKYAIDFGYRHIDCAYFYENEKEIGIGVKEKICEGVIQRDDMFITSKLWNTYHSPHLVPKLCCASLCNFGFEYLDLYLLHWPMGFEEGGDHLPKDSSGRYKYSDVDYVDTWLAMENLVKQGLTRSIGISNFNIKQVTRILDCGSIKPVVNQIECHPYLTQPGLTKFCKQCDIAITAYSPLGARTHAFKKHKDADLMKEPIIRHIAKMYGKNTAQVLLRYHIDRGNTCIPKSVTPKRIKANFDIFDFKLTEKDLQCINCLDRGGKLRYFPLDEMRDHKYYPFKDNDYF